MTILVAHRDYRRGRVIPGTNFRLVTPAFVFYRNEGATFSDRCTGNVDEYFDLRGNTESKFREDIFVPFVSERYMDPKEQRRLFPPSTLEQARAYLFTPRQEAVKRAVQNSRNFWYRHGLGLWLAGVLTASLLVGVFGNLAANERENRAKPITFTTVHRTADGLSAIRISKPQKIGELPPVRDSELMSGLAKAVVTEDPIYMGGGIVSVRVRFADGKRTVDGGVRASSVLNLKKGDAVVVRYGDVMLRAGYYSAERWVIGKEEADVLLKSGFSFKLSQE